LPEFDSIIIIIIWITQKLICLGTSFPKALAIVKAEKNHVLDVSRLAMSHFIPILPNELAKQTALNRWIAAKRRWKGKNVSRGSSVIDEMRWPKAELKPVASSHWKINCYYLLHQHSKQQMVQLFFNSI